MPDPMKCVLIGTSSCSASGVVHILERGREPVGDSVVEVEAERATEDPKVFTRIRKHIVAKGP